LPLETTEKITSAVDDYLPKPIGQPDLLTMIRTVLSSPIVSTNDLPNLLPLFDEKPSLKIILAEDNAINLMVATNILQQAGHSFMIAKNGQDAVEKWKRDSFDLILMDIHMPKMDGFEATTLIREEEQNSDKHIPIIALTANAIKGDSERCIAGVWMAIYRNLSRALNYCRRLTPLLLKQLIVSSLCLRRKTLRLILL